MSGFAINRPAPLRLLGSRAWRALDLPHLAFAIMLGWLLWALDLADPDYWWHLAAGEWIVTHHALPQGDPFSWTFQGKPWVLHEWLFEVLLVGVRAGLGDAGVKLLTAGCVTLAAYFVYRTALRLLRIQTLALLVALPVFAVELPFAAPRPQVLSYVLFAWLVQQLVYFKYFGEHKRLRWVPALMVLWVNLHGAYIVGIALLAMFCVAEWLPAALRERDFWAAQRVRELVLITLLGGLSTAINPDFIQRWLYPLQVANLDFALSVVAEWRSPSFHALSGKIFLAATFCFFLANIYRPRPPDLTEMLLPLFFLYAAFSAARHMPLAALIAAPFVAASLRDGPLHLFYVRGMRQGKELGDTEYRLNWLVLAVLVATAAMLYPKRAAEAPERLNQALPVRAAEALQAAGQAGNLFNEYGDGGYLIHALYPRQRVFIDGRADLYGDPFLKEFLSIRDGEHGWEQAFDKYAIDWVLLGRDAPLVSLLRMRGDFATAFEDDKHVLLKKQPRARCASTCTE